MSLRGYLIAIGRALKSEKHRRADAERERAEALVEVERRGMMGGRSPEMKLRPVVRAPRRQRYDNPSLPNNETSWTPIGTVSCRLRSTERLRSLAVQHARTLRRRASMPAAARRAAVERTDLSEQWS